MLADLVSQVFDVILEQLSFLRGNLEPGRTEGGKHFPEDLEVTPGVGGVYRSADEVGPFDGPANGDGHEPELDVKIKIGDGLRIKADDLANGVKSGTDKGGPTATAHQTASKLESANSTTAWRARSTRFRWSKTNPGWAS